jgi:hypothetical protein
VESTTAATVGSDFFLGGRPGPRFIRVVTGAVGGGILVAVVVVAEEDDDNNVDDDNIISSLEDGFLVLFVGGGRCSGP